MNDVVVGILVAHLFIWLVAGTFAGVAAWRRWSWRHHYGPGIYLVLVVPSLTLFRAVGGDRGAALLTIVLAVAGLALLLAGRPRSEPRT